MKYKYPSHLDLEWLCVDCVGRIGIFTTGGAGPVPEVYLEDSLILGHLSEVVRALPETSDCQFLANIAQPADDFVAFARRGLFSFDWADVHRTTEYIDMYEIQVRPSVPLTIEGYTWPVALRTFLAKVTSPLIDFGQPTVDVCSALKCVRQERFGP
jgi:hypothetical protein